MHQVRIGRSPAYLADMMTATADLPGRERLPFRQQFRYETPNWKSSLVSGLSRTLDRRRGTHFLSNLQELLNEHWYF